jgi:poly(A) polymerase
MEHELRTMGTRVLDDAPWLESGAAARVLALLNGNGEEARVIGGAVRNALLRVPIVDIDIATTALPKEVVRRAKAAGIKSVPTGIDHGTVTLVVDSHPFEVTTLREDTETFGRKAKVAFGRDWVADAHRRDFTINALSVDAGCVVHDYVGGLNDIAARRVRFIGDPDQRLAEDYLRILRFFRIHAAFGMGEPDRAGYLACLGARDGLTTLSAERIRMEMLKLLVADGAVTAIAAMAEGGLLLQILGGVAYTGPFAAMIAAEQVLGLKADAVRRLAALAVAVTEDARRLGARLRLANAETKALDSMGHRWWRLGGMDEATARRRLYRLGAERYRDRLLLAWSRAGGHADAARWRELATLPQRWSAPKFPLKAADFVKRGVAEGPALGHVLALAEDAWLAADFPLDAAALAAIADQAVTRVSRDGRP